MKFAADLTEIRSLSSKNGGVKYSLCAIEVFTKYAWIKILKGKKAKTDLHGFVGILNESKRKQNKLCVEKGRKFYSSPMQKW